MFVEADVPLLLAVGAAGVWALVYELHTRRTHVAKKKSSSYRSEAIKEPFELELVSGDIVTFRDPGKLPLQSVWDTARGSNDIEGFFVVMLSEADHAAWWSEYKDRPQEEAVALQTDVMTHFRSAPRADP